MNRAGLSEIDPHPTGSISDFCIWTPDLSSRGLILRFPDQQIVVASLSKMQEAAYRHQEVQRRIKLLARRKGQQRLGVRPVAQLVHRRDQRQPAGDVVVSQTSRSIFHI